MKHNQTTTILFAALLLAACAREPLLKPKPGESFANVPPGGTEVVINPNHYVQSPVPVSYVYLSSTDAGTWDFTKITQKSVEGLTNAQTFVYPSKTIPNKYIALIKNTTTGFYGKVAITGTAVAGKTYKHWTVTNETGKTLYQSYDEKDSIGAHWVSNEVNTGLMPPINEIGDFTHPAPDPNLVCQKISFGACLTCLHNICESNVVCREACELIPYHLCQISRAIYCFVENTPPRGCCPGHGSMPGTYSVGVFDPKHYWIDNTIIFKPF